MDLETMARRALLVWLASICAVGFVIAPVAFAAFDRMPGRAGEFLRPFFAGVDWFGVAASMLMILACRTKRVRLTLAVVMGAAALLDRLWLAPKIAVRAEPFALYHGLSTGAWMLILLLGVAVLWVGRRDCAAS